MDRERPSLPRLPPAIGRARVLCSVLLRLRHAAFRADAGTATSDRADNDGCISYNKMPAIIRAISRPVAVASVSRNAVP